MGHKVYKGKKVQAQVKVQDTLLLSRYMESDVTEKKKPNHSSCNPVDYDQCIYDTLSSRMKAATKNKCTVPWITNNDNICRDAEDINTAFWTHYNRSTNQKADCPTKCHIVSANVLGKNFETLKSDDEDGILFSYFSLDVEKRKEEYLYNGYRLIAEVANYIYLK